MVHLLQLVLSCLQGVRRWVELVGLKALIGEADGERLVILLYSTLISISLSYPGPCDAVPSFPNGVSTNLRDVLGVRGRSVGGNGTTGKGGKSLAPKRRGLTGRSTEEHCAGGGTQLKMG